MTGVTRRRAALGILAAAAAGPLLAACQQSADGGRTFVSATFAPGAGTRVAVLPFENLTAHPSAGLICAQLTSTELYQRGLFAQLEETAIRRTLADNRVDISKLSDRTYALEVAQLLDVDAVLIGSVSEYGYQHGLREEPSVGINVRLVGTRDGEVLWASSRADVGAGFWRRESVNETAQRLVGLMVDGLESRLP